LRGGQSGDDVTHDDVGRFEAERGRVADVELQDAVAFGLETRRVLVHRPADLVQHVLQLARLRELTRACVLATARLPRRLMGTHIDNSPMVVDAFFGRDARALGI
jgi:hypothetical protein